MLSHVEVTARAITTPAAHFVWSNRLEFTHDCFVCLRVGRTMRLRHGMPFGFCAEREHRAPIAVTGFDASDHGASDHGTERRLRCRITSWWAVFNDQVEPEVQASELTAEPWARLNYRVGCHPCRDAGVDDWLGIEESIHSGLTWPVTSSCPRCETELVRMTEPPEIRLVA